MTPQFAYSLQGSTIGSCGCSVSIDCFCWDAPKQSDKSSKSSGCGDSFVAYAIDQGMVQGVDVSHLVLVRVVRESEQRSFFYLDAKATPEQNALLTQAFGGELGGILADLQAVLPTLEAPRVAPIVCERDPQDRHTHLTIGSLSLGDQLSRQPFSFQA